MNARVWRFVASLLILGLALAACGGEQPAVITVVVTSPPSGSSPAPEGPSPTAPVTGASVEILEATFAHGLSEDMQPVEPGSAFAPEETIYLALRLKGRPKEGTVTARFYYGDTFIAEAGIDLADSNSGLLFSFGEDTNLGYTLTHEQPFPAGEEYRADVFYGDVALATYPFRVVAASGTLVSRINDVLLALGADENYEPINPTTIFAFDEEVHLVGEGDLAAGSTLQADWYIEGQLDEEGTRVLTLDQDIAQAGFVFSYLPDGGWPPGEHSVVLTLDGEEIARFPFLIVEGGGAAPLIEPDFWDAFPVPDDAEAIEVVEGMDIGYATSMNESQLFEYYAAWLRSQGWELVAAQGASGLIQDWAKDGARLHLELQGFDDQGRAVIWAQLEAAE